MFLNYSFRPCGQCDTANPAFWQPIEFSCGNLDNANFAGPVSLRCDLLNLTTTSRVTSTTRTSTSTTVSTTTLTTTTPPERTTQQNNPSTTRPVEVVTYDAGVCPSDRRRCSVLLSADCRETLPEPFVLDGDRCGNSVCARCAYVNNIPRQTEIAARFFFVVLHQNVLNVFKKFMLCL